MEVKNGITLTKKVKNGELVKKTVASEGEFLKMVKTGSVEQLKALQTENLKLKDTLAQVVKKVKELAYRNILEPISKASPELYTELKQLIDPSKSELEKAGFVTHLQEKEFYASLKFSLPPSTQQMNLLLGTVKETMDKLTVVMSKVIAMPSLLKVINLVNGQNPSALTTVDDLMKRLGSIE